MNNYKLIQKIEKTYNFSCLGIIPLRESSDNKVFILKIDQNVNYILRVSKRDVGENVLFELNWIENLAKRGFPTTNIIKTRNNQLYFYYEELVGVVFKFIDGYHMKIDKQNKPDSAHIKKAAKLLAKLHNISSELTLEYPRKRTILTELERVLDRKEKFEKLIEGGKEFISKAIKNLAWTQKEKYEPTFIINDFRPGNVIFKNKDNATLIDFDWSCIGPSIKDFALGITEWSFPDGAEKPWEDIFELFLNSYNKESKKQFAQNDYLYKWICFACLSDTATYLCDMIDAGIYKKVSSSYMYQKYLYFFSKIKDS